MNEVELTRDALILEALNVLAQKSRITPSALLLLNFPFTDTQITGLDRFLNQSLFYRQALSAADVAEQLHQVRPEMSAKDYHFLAQDLIKAWKKEDRYHGLVFA
ncbi:hypothetical protein [Levilactobacillus yiduensis]|uniref:hypothetical protein n=1 Tax=Levilactobacillus yiduensis TaxID=2953880 RepID=UPI000EF354C6|nr:hypothetical protein [Levilactobacillus yiduensis]AYM01474.1 hypothetical protein D8911_00135 [Levilactobacillus brevis]